MHINVLILAMIWKTFVKGPDVFVNRPDLTHALTFPMSLTISLLLSLALCKRFLCQDLSSWSSADELDTSGSLSPVSGRSTPSRRRSVTHTLTCARCSMRGQVFSYPSECIQWPVPQMHRWRPYPPLPSQDLSSHLSTPPQPALSSLPLNSEPFPGLLLFLHVVDSQSKPCQRLGAPCLLNFYFFLLFLGWLFQFCPSCHLFSSSTSRLKKNLPSHKTFFPLDFPLISSHSSFGLVPVVLFSEILAIMKLLVVQKKHRNCCFMI